MKVLLIHSKGFSYEATKKTDAKKIEEIPPDKRKFKTEDNVLVAFITVEEDDENYLDEIVEGAANEIGELASELDEKNIILYPYAHLSSSLASPGPAIEILQNLEKVISSKGFNVHKSPFGWYKSFEMDCIGHPRAETLREIIPTEKKEIVVEEHPESTFYVLTPDNELIKLSPDLEPDKPFDFSKHLNLKKFIAYEVKKERTEKEEPPHISLMKRHEIADYEIDADPGNLRWYAKGAVLRNIIEDYVYQRVIDFGGIPIETPIMYSLENPIIREQVSRFPARQYQVKSGKKILFLRYAGDFGQFFLVRDMPLSYRNLPLRIYELTKYSFRREKRGEVVGLRRLRAFTMPDLHTFCADVPAALEEFDKQYHLCRSILEEIGGFEYETAFRTTNEFFNEHREWILSLVKATGKPALIELFPGRYFYWILKFEFNFVDSVEKAAALSTVQIDVESAKRYGITYVASDGSKINPVILHDSPSGAIERVVYAVLEKAAIDTKEGRVPEFPLWLATTQCRILPVSDRHLEYCQKIMEEMNQAEIRTDIDDRDETLGEKIRKAEMEWVPFIAVIGDKEISEGTISVRLRAERQEKTYKLDELKNLIKEKTKGKLFVELPPSLRNLSTRPTFVGG